MKFTVEGNTISTPCPHCGAKIEADARQAIPIGFCSNRRHELGIGKVSVVFLRNSPQEGFRAASLGDRR